MSVLSGVSLFRSSTHSVDCQSILFNKVATFSFLCMFVWFCFCSGRINKKLTIKHVDNIDHDINFQNFILLLFWWAQVLVEDFRTFAWLKNVIKSLATICYHRRKEHKSELQSHVLLDKENNIIAAVLAMNIIFWVVLNYSDLHSDKIKRVCHLFKRRCMLLWRSCLKGSVLQVKDTMTLFVFL